MVSAVALIAAACGGAEDPAESLSAESPTTTTSVVDLDEGESSPVAEAERSDVVGEDSPVPEVEPDIVHPVASIAWEPCGEIECGTLDLPLDYRIDGGETISIAINRVAAGDPSERLGVLLVNPGGPGGDGTDLAERFASGDFPTELTDRFDIIGFDPRGVGDSGPNFACGASGEQLELLATIEDLIDEPDEVDAVEAAVQLCVDSMGDAAGLIHTGNVVRDMDEIRRSLDEDQISFLGYSYGSTIGVWYATLFPDNVRAMVIDGADNPIDDLSDFDARLQSAREETAPLEDLLAEALSACDSTTCPIFNDGDPQGFYFDAVEKFPLITEASAGNPNAGVLGLITPLYNESLWPTLWQGLADLEERDDPTIFVDLAEFQLGADPGAVNITGYINCLDGWALQPEFDREARLSSSEEFFAIEDELGEEFPLLFAIADGLASTCSFMDVLNTPQLEVPLDGAGVPILVVGNTSDPVTSFGESEELVEETLANGFLLEVDHGSHTVYPQNPCVNDAVHDVLLDIAFPDERIVCERVDTSAESILLSVCIELGPHLSPDLRDDQLAEGCAAFAATSIDRIGEDEALSALGGDDDEGAATLRAILDESLSSAGN